MRKTAIVQRRGSTVDAWGQPDTTWSALTTTRCALRPLAGAEFFAASGEGSKITTEVRMRYKDALSTFTPADRLSIEDVLYDVTSIINVQARNRELVVMCSEVDRDN
jgi:SPP1 family predicted phage head-tail adaptor